MINALVLSSTLPLLHSFPQPFPLKGACTLVLGLALWGSARAQPGLGPDTLVTSADVEVLARFEQASALAVDPTGRLYVTDAGADVVVQLAADGAVQERAGGTGSRPGQFDEPADVDPTNGLAIFVADAGNARVQHFARSFRFLESIPVGPEAGAGARPTYDRVDDTFATDGGRPIAVASASSGELYVVDAVAGHVVQWSPGRRTRHIIGGFDAGPGALGEPVALVLGNDERLYVVDRARTAVVVYDALGSYVTTLADSRTVDVQHLLVVDGFLWLVHPGGVQVYDPQGRFERAWIARLDAPLVDAARQGGTTYLLTTDTLYRMRR